VTTQAQKPGYRRILILVLLGVLAILQARLWVSEDGFSEVRRLRGQVTLQRDENARLAERNDRLEAEVVDLRGGFAAVEERARSDLGLVAPDESFYVFAAPAYGSGDREEVEAE
jgi:cell division protein FtsB